MSEKEFSNEETEKKEKTEREEYRKVVLFGSLLYGILGIIAIIIPLLNQPVAMPLVYVGIGILVFVLTQTLWVLIRENLSKVEKVILIILNLPVYLLFTLSDM